MIPGAKKSAFTLHDILLYVAVAAKYARLMLLLVCFALTAGLTYYVFAKPVYYSHAVIDVDYLARPVDTDNLYRDGYLNSITGQLTAPHILARTARALGVSASGRELDRKYLFKLRARLNSEKNIEVEIWPWSADWAHRWTETMVREFLAYRQEKRIEDKTLLLSNYSSELKDVVARLDKQFSEKLDFQDQNDFTRTLILVNSINNLPAELTQLQKQIDEFGRVRVRLQDSSLDAVARLSLIFSMDRPETRLNVGQTVANSSVGNQSNRIPDSGGVVVVPSMIHSVYPWDNLATERQEIRAEIEEASRLYLPGHRKMVELTNRLTANEERLDAELQVAMERFDLQYAELLNKKHDYEAKLPEYKELSRKHAKLLSQLSVFDHARVPYDQYLAEMKKRMDVVDFGGEKERINLRYAGLLDVRDTPVSPNRMRLMLMSLVAGVTLAIGVPFIIEYLDHTLSNSEEIEKTFRLRGLGIVPQSEGREMLTSDETEQPPKHGLVENFRVIRTNLLSMGALTKQPQVIMVTSAVPREGKTVVSSNLAASFALTGARTLLIDTDLRRGRLHRLFGYRKEPGLSNVLLGEVSLDQALRSGVRDNLSVLSAGRHLESGTELLGSDKFAVLMNELRGRFERIVVDTPPVLGLSETSIMQNFVDGVLFVIWTSHTPKRGIETAIETLRSNGANFYGFVLNRLDLNATQNYYQYYYYSEDYYYQNALENA